MTSPKRRRGKVGGSQIDDGAADRPLALAVSVQVACETCTKTGMVMIFGEISTSASVNYEEVVRKTCRVRPPRRRVSSSCVQRPSKDLLQRGCAFSVQDIGYDDEAKGLDYKTMKVVVAIEEQSPDIAQAVHINKAAEEIGAGDQVGIQGSQRSSVSFSFLRLPRRELFSARAFPAFRDTCSATHATRPPS